MSEMLSVSEYAEVLKKVQETLDDAHVRSPCFCHGQCSDCEKILEAERLVATVQKRVAAKAEST
jgi:hypothetical protein